MSTDERCTHLHSKTIHGQPIKFYASVAIDLKDVTIGMLRVMMMMMMMMMMMLVIVMMVMVMLMVMVMVMVMMIVMMKHICMIRFNHLSNHT